MQMGTGAEMGCGDKTALMGHVLLEGSTHLPDYKGVADPVFRTHIPMWYHQRPGPTCPQKCAQLWPNEPYGPNGALVPDEPSLSAKGA